MPHHDFARALRLRRLHRAGGRRLVIVPLDHSVNDGPLMPAAALDRLVGQLSGSGVDAVVLHKGTARHLQPRWFTGMSLLVHLSASTVHAADPDAKYLVSGVEEALRLGADGVSVHVNLGSVDEARQIADLAAVAAACDLWNVPLLAMVYPRGPGITDPRDPALIAHAAGLAADLGADVVKTPFAGTVAEMADVTAGCPIPLVVAGGPPLQTEDAVLEHVRDVLDAGAAGVAMGRNVFRAADPGGLARRVSALVHGRTDDGRRGHLEPLGSAG